jgi:hypothetical protein
MDTVSINIIDHGYAKTLVQESEYDHDALQKDTWDMFRMFCSLAIGGGFGDHFQFQSGKQELEELGTRKLGLLREVTLNICFSYSIQVEAVESREPSGN